MSKISLILVIYYRNFCWFTEIVTFFVNNFSSNFVTFSMNKISHVRVLFLLILVLTADWAPCGDGCQRRGGHWGGAAGRWSGRPRGAPPPSRSTCRPRYNLQFHPARGKSLIIVLQDKNEALPTGWMKKRQFWSTLSEGVELMTGFDWYNVATIFCEKKMSLIWVIIFLKILKSVKITAILVD